MSGIFYEEKWYENTGRLCPICNTVVYERGHKYLCLLCKRELHVQEMLKPEEQPIIPVLIARPVGGISINNSVEYLLDDNGKARVFPSQSIAEFFLERNGYLKDELVYFYFVEILNESEITI